MLHESLMRRHADVVVLYLTFRQQRGVGQLEVDIFSFCQYMDQASSHCAKVGLWQLGPGFKTSGSFNGLPRHSPNIAKEVKRQHMKNGANTITIGFQPAQ